MNETVEGLASVLWAWNAEKSGGIKGYPYDRLIEPTKDDLRELVTRLLPFLSAITSAAQRSEAVKVAREAIIGATDCVPSGGEGFVGWSEVLAERVVDAVLPLLGRPVLSAEDQILEARDHDQRRAM